MAKKTQQNRIVQEPQPVAIGEEVPESDCGRCRTPSCGLPWLWYQRQERPKYPRHFLFCGICGARYAAWDGYNPFGASSCSSVDAG